MFGRILPLITLTSCLMIPAYAGAQSSRISGERIRAHVKYLASDELEGRGVGTRAEKLTGNYIASQLKQAGVSAGGENGSYFQKVSLVGVTTKPEASLRVVSGKSGQAARTFAFGKDFVGTSFSQKPTNNFRGDVVFVGHGINAPEFKWDDYKGVDLKGKVLVYITNEPPSLDSKFFGGRALTYYGRWTYKFEEATRRGAAAAIIIHTTPTAGYGWATVRGSGSHERPEMKLGAGERGLPFAGWITESAGEELVKSTGKTVAELLEMANQSSFKPIPLGFQMAANIPVTLRNIDSTNVIGRVEGADPQLKKQVVTLTAHWDHLGLSSPVDGDKIYNGAVDNATGCGMVLEMARQWNSLPVKPKRSGLFLFVTAEESGLLGSQFYGEHPIVPPAQTAANLNFDGFSPFGPTKDVEVTGAERTTLWPLVQQDAKQMQLTISPDAQPEQGHYYRSDHFSLARVGVPAFSISAGTTYIGKPSDYGKKIFEEYNEKHYHQPSDEYHDDWNFSGMAQMTEFGFKLGLDIANQPSLPTWHEGDEFLKIRQQSGVQ